MPGNDEELDYRSPVSSGSGPFISTPDEQNYSTLIEVLKDFDQGLYELAHDFNAFDLSGKEMTLEVQVAGRQYAYDLLMPLREKIQSAVNDVSIKNQR